MANGVQRRIQDLLAYPREDLSVELKGWLDLSVPVHRADLAKAMIALANSGGGYVLVGFVEAEGTWCPDESNRPSALDVYSQDQVNGIVQRYAEPSFHCEVHHLPHSENGQTFPVVVVPGEHRVPIRAKRDGADRRHIRQNEYYIRRPGPKSETPQTGQEWDDLINRCIRSARDELMDGFRGLLFGLADKERSAAPERDILTNIGVWTKLSRSRWNELVQEELKNEQPSRYAHGVWSISYRIKSDFSLPTLNDLKEILSKVQGHETGWPPWWVPTRSEIAPYVFDGVIECWLAETHFGDAAHSDFWRASPRGMLYLLRGYQEDSEAKGYNLGTIFDLTLPIWRIGECLLHAERFSTALTGLQQAEIIIEARWDGLKGRALTAWANRRRTVYSHRSRERTVTSRSTLTTNEIRDNLSEAVKQVVEPLYAVFDFFSPSIGLIQEELSEMRKGR